MKLWPGFSKAAIPLQAHPLEFSQVAWKLELARLAAETGLTITVCHLPPATCHLPPAAGHRPGTSKWNKIEHRLFSHITMNWRGRPLTSHEVIVQSIAATTTRTGLRVHAEFDASTYPTGVKIGDAERAALPLTRHGFHGDYVLRPQSAPPIPAARPHRHQRRSGTRPC